MKRLFTMVMILGLFACSDSSNTPQSLIGLWEVQDCTPGMSEESRIVYTMGSYEFNPDNTFHMENTYFDSPECNSDAYTTYTGYGTYTLGENLIAASGESVTKLTLAFTCTASGSGECIPLTVDVVFYIENDTLFFGTMDDDATVSFYEDIYLKVY